MHALTPTLLLVFTAFRMEERLFCYGVEFNFILVGEKGSFASPNFPQNYPRNATSTWEIQVPHGRRFRIQFVHFILENSKRCRYDYVKIRFDRTVDWEQLTGYCRTAPGIFETKGSTAELRFVSDPHGNEFSGFSAEWSVIEMPSPTLQTSRISLDILTTAVAESTSTLRDTSKTPHLLATTGCVLHSSIPPQSSVMLPDATFRTIYVTISHCPSMLPTLQTRPLLSTFYFTSQSNDGPQVAISSERTAASASSISIPINECLRQCHLSATISSLYLTVASMTSHSSSSELSLLTPSLIPSASLGSVETYGTFSARRSMMSPYLTLPVRTDHKTPLLTSSLRSHPKTPVLTSSVRTGDKTPLTTSLGKENLRTQTSLPAESLAQNCTVIRLIMDAKRGSTMEPGMIFLLLVLSFGCACALGFLVSSVLRKRRVFKSAPDLSNSDVTTSFGSVTSHAHAPGDNRWNLGELSHADNISTRGQTTSQQGNGDGNAVLHLPKSTAAAAISAFGATEKKVRVQNHELSTPFI